MKNSKLLIALITPLILTGCGSSKVSFKDDLKVERELTISEAAVVTNKVAEKIVDELTGFTEKGKSEESNLLGGYVEEWESKFKLYSDNYARNEASYTYTYTNYGVTVSSSEKGTIELFDDQEQKSIVEFAEYKSNNGIEYADFDWDTYTDETAEETRKGFVKYALNKNYAYPDLDYTAFLLKGGTYAFIYSTSQVNVEYFGYESGTKEFRQEEKSQTIIKVDKNYKITSYTEFHDVTTNRDPATGEWYKKAKSVSHTENTRTYSYGKRAASGKLLNKAVYKVSGEYIYNYGVCNAEYGQFDSATNTYTKGGNLSSGSDYFYTCGFSKYHYERVYSGYVGGDNNAILLKAAAAHRASFTAEEAEMKYANITLGDYQTVTLENGDVLMLVEPNRSYNIALELTFSASNGELVVEQGPACYIGTALGYY